MNIIMVKIKKIFFVVISLFLTFIFYECLCEEFYNRTQGEDLLRVLVCIYFCFVFAIVLTTILHFIFKPFMNFINDKIIEEKYKKNINFEYYRDIIKNYSISTICYCLGKKINYKDEFVAILLKLEMENKIKINEDKIRINDVNDMYLSEKNILNYTKQKNVFSYKSLKKIIKDNNKIDFVSSDLYYESWSVFEDNLFILLFMLFIISLGLVIWLKEIMSIIGLASLLVILAIYGINVFEQKLRLNEKGFELKYKLFGLRKFISEFSIIDERSVPEIDLWNYYIIYAILFNGKGKLDKSAKNTYNKYCKLFNISLIEKIKLECENIWKKFILQKK